ncbi:deleted in malignant brain tumors 1 protein-like [Bolinopsis microptera]|uniref:deleted in malignant brain tumors 1 protein-like n=1 Tax=Bolinopsis microptera TaxID=2820187 RepID=UPI0030792E48
MILFAVFVMLSLQGVWAGGFYLLDANQQVTTSGKGLLMYSGGTVCEDAFNDETADWICRMMGYASLDFWTNGRKYTWHDKYPIKLDDIQCSGSVVPYCEYDTSHNCYHIEDVWLSCKIKIQKGDLNSFYLLDNTEMFTQSGHGLLMYQEGTVSYDGFDDTTADWICRFMGYENAADWVNDRQFSFQDDLPIKLNNLVCSNTSYSDILPKCQSRIGTADDSHDEDIWIWCNSVVIAECPAGYKVKLKNKLCQECPPTTYSPTPNTNFTCLHCPEGSSSPAASPYCTCVGGSYLSADYSSCQACPTGTASKEGSTSSGQCVLCPEGMISIDDGKACSCNKGYGWLWTSAEEGTCSPCPVNSFKTLGTCRQCPVEATSLPLSEGCTCAVGLSWDGEIVWTVSQT